jgi:hypothetical protein
LSLYSSLSFCKTHTMTLLILQVLGGWPKTRIILAGNSVYVGLLLIPKKNSISQHKNTICLGDNIGCRGINATESSWVLYCEILVFFSYVST